MRKEHIATGRDNSVSSLIPEPLFLSRLLILIGIISTSCFSGSEENQVIMSILVARKLIIFRSNPFKDNEMNYSLGALGSGVSVSRQNMRHDTVDSELLDISLTSLMSNGFLSHCQNIVFQCRTSSCKQN